MGIKYAAAVQYADTFLVVGGYWEHGDLNNILQYRPETGEWSDLPVKLAIRRYQHFGVMVPVDSLPFACNLGPTPGPTTTTTTTTTTTQPGGGLGR